MTSMVEVDADGNVVLWVYVQPGARSDGVVGRHGDALKVRVSAPPEAGRANKAVTALLADALGVPHRSVEIVSGGHTRSKRIRVVGVDPATVAERLGILWA
jgi:uncharacterized protein